MPTYLKESIKMKDLAILGIGNILQKDDGIAIYATSYLEANYSFSPNIDIINGGVQGINLLNLFMEYKYILILDTIDIDDKAGTIYHIPSNELTGYSLNFQGAHEMGVLQCLEMLELMGEALPESSVLGIVPKEIETHIGLSKVMQKKFGIYIKTLLAILKELEIEVKPNTTTLSLEEIIEKY